tara:strand:- start:405 stop:2012 length:1608 start_codon:yes stop_codon:yes gene_type:complete
MKYINFKSYKFSTILKYINFKRYRFSKYIDFGTINFPKIFRNVTINFTKIFRNTTVNFTKILKKYTKHHKRYLLYASGFCIFSFFAYLNIPAFYNYDKLDLENKICKKINIKCVVKGKIGYNFFPYPRITISDFIITDDSKSKVIKGHAKKVSLKISLTNFFRKDSIKINKIVLNDAKIDLNLKNFEIQKKFSYLKNIMSPLKLDGEINFLDDNDYVSTIKNVNLNYKSYNDKEKATLKGDFLNDLILIKFNSEKNLENYKKNVSLKVSAINLLSKFEIIEKLNEKNIKNGKFFIRQSKNKIAGVFDYTKGKINIKHSNVGNVFLDGKVHGTIEILPYFNFDLNFDLNNLNFNALSNLIVSLNSDSKKNLFKINDKINGKVNLSVDKIFSKRTLINSMESRFRFVHGNILVDQLLLDLKKIGAADVTGIIEREKKYLNFKFEKNIFLDNLKRFYSNFGIYNKQNAYTNVFISGTLDLLNLQVRINKIIGDKELKNADIEYIEREFNETVLEKGYESFFDYRNIKKFVKNVMGEEN